jgi:N utilization substance protein B
MYLYLLQLIVEMQGMAIEKIESGRNKKLPTPEDLNPNTKFVTNIPLRMLSNSKKLRKECERTGVSWSDNMDLVKKIFKSLTATEDYIEYMSSKTRGFEHDREFLLRFFKRHMVNEELLHDYFEEKSIFWNDDLDLMAGMAIKTIKLIDEDADDIELLSLWKDAEDEQEFMKTLFRQTLAKGEESEKLIDEYTKNWELERIAMMDVILMKMALAEARSFPSIPLKVTLNEYIELSKYYSTPKSNSFINGVLDQLFTKLKEDGTIAKSGRGLIDE